MCNRKNGVAKRKRESDGKTPIGKHQIVGMLYRPDRISRTTQMGATIRPRDIWSDDIKDPNYNLMGTAAKLHFNMKNFSGPIIYMI